MISMVKSYHASIAGLVPAVDIHEKLMKVSRKFRKLAENAGAASGAAAVQF